MINEDLKNKLLDNGHINEKKKRGRKPKIVDILEVSEKIPKKRGRKSKDEKREEVSNYLNDGDIVTLKIGNKIRK